MVALDGAGARVRRHERGGGYVRSGRLWGAPILPLLSNTAPAWAARVLASSENIAHGCTSHVSFWGVNTGRYLPPCPARRKAANALRRPRKLLAVRGSAALPVWPAPPPAPGRATPPPPPPPPALPSSGTTAPRAGRADSPRRLLAPPSRRPAHTHAGMAVALGAPAAAAIVSQRQAFASPESWPFRRREDMRRGRDCGGQAQDVTLHRKHAPSPVYPSSGRAEVFCDATAS